MHTNEPAAAATHTNTTAASHPAPHDPASPLPWSIFRLKRCRNCGEEKPLHRYYRQRGCEETHRPDCKSCLAKEGRQRRAEAHATRVRRGERRCRYCAQLKPLAEYSGAVRPGQRPRRTVCRTCREQRAAQPPQPLEGLNRPDSCLQRNSRQRLRRIDLGLAILAATSAPGECHTLEEIAAYAGVSVEIIRQIELQALAKLQTGALDVLRKAGLAGVQKVAL